MDEIEKYDFSNGDEFSDFKLVVDNKIIYVHKAILGKIVFKDFFKFKKTHLFTY